MSKIIYDIKNIMIDEKKSYIESTQFSLPMILRTVKQSQQQNEILFKTDSQSSIAQIKQVTINNNIASITKIEPQIDQLRKFIKKADDLNNFNVKKLQQQKQVRQFPKYQRSSGSLFRLNRQFSIERIQGIEPIRLRNFEKQKKIKKAYIQPSKNQSFRQKKVFKPSITQRKPIKYNKQIQTQNNQPIKKELKQIEKQQKHKKNIYNTIQHNNQQHHRYVQDEDELPIPKKATKRKTFHHSFNQTVSSSKHTTINLEAITKKDYEFQRYTKNHFKLLSQRYQPTAYFENSRPISIMHDPFSSQVQAQSGSSKIGKGQATQNLFMTESNVNNNQQMTKTSNLGNFLNSFQNNHDISQSVCPQKSSTRQKLTQPQQFNFFGTKKGNERGGAQNINIQKSIKKNSAKNDYNDLKQKGVQIMIQVPSIHELKICQNYDKQTNKKIKLHPIRNEFDEDNLDWIIQQFKPKNKQIFNQSAYSLFKIKKYRNGVYFGELNQQGQKNGKGVIFYYNGRIYEGQFSKDIKSGKGYQAFPNGATYKGYFNNGLKQGKGRFQWANGELYDGQWEAGKKHGSGMWKSQNGQSYIGQWKNGKVEGFGVYTMTNGDRYQGQFFNSLKHGVGTQRYTNGDTYVGNFYKNRANGFGEYYWSNGDHYKGDFSNGLKNGQGILKNQSKNSIYKGSFRNDKKSGYGEMKDEQHDELYVGNFENDFKHGYGQLYKSNNECVFKGYWLNNQMVNQLGIPIIQQLQREQSLAVIKKGKKNNSPKNRKEKVKSTMKKSPLLKNHHNHSKSPQDAYMRACGCKKKH